MPRVQKQDLKTIALQIRKKIIQMLVPKESHHIGCSLSIVEILTVLYFRILKINPKNSSDPNRDIFILSKGHAAASVYATLATCGFFSSQLLSTYDRDGGLLPEHITRVVPGIEVSTGSLGHGLPIGVGFALGIKQQKRWVYVLMSDGELNEGSNWEAVMFAGFHQIDNLVVIVDGNGLQGYGTTKKVLDLGKLTDKIAPFGWNTYEVDGHNMNKLQTLLEKVRKSQNRKPHLIFAHTIKGKGIPEFEGKFESHYYSISEDLKQNILKKI